MLKPRYIRQRQMTGLSLSLLVHAGAAIAISLTPTKLLHEPQELAEAVYLEDTGAALPQGTQTEALPAAGTTEDSRSAKTEQTGAGDNTPVAKAPEPAPSEGDVVVPVKIVEAKPEPKELPKKVEPKKAQPPTALPAKPNVAKSEPAAETDLSVKSALDSARNEKTTDLEGVETETQGEDSPVEVAKDVNEREEEEEAPAVLAPIKEEEQLAQQVEEKVTEEAPAPAVAPLIAQESKPAPQPKQAQAAAQPAPGVLRRLPPAQNPSNDSSASGSTGAVGGIGSTHAYGIRDASELKAMPGNRAPVYPERDRLMRNQGTTVFVARVLPDGTVADIQLEKSAQSKSLDTSALEAMKKWRFQPGQQGMVRKGFTFSLGGEAEELPARLRR